MRCSQVKGRHAGAGGGGLVGDCVHLNETQQQQQRGSKEPGLQSVTLWYFLLLFFDAAAARKPEMFMKLG